MEIEEAQRDTALQLCFRAAPAAEVCELAEIPRLEASDAAKPQAEALLLREI